MSPPTITANGDGDDVLADPEAMLTAESENAPYELHPPPKEGAPLASTVSDAVSTLSCTCEWTIPNFLSITDTKIVSAPFGPSDWRWEMVLYPHGSPGSNCSHLSCFLRPVKNQNEINAGDSWTRPILNFTIQVFKGSGGSIADMFGAPPTHGSVNREVLIQDTSASSFTAFDTSHPGWGFTYLLDLSCISDAISYTGSLTLAAIVSADFDAYWTASTVSALPSDEESLALRAKLYAVESDLARAKEDLRLHISSSVDPALFESKPSTLVSRKMSLPSGGEDTVDVDKLPVAQAIQNLKNELESARASLDEATERSSLILSSTVTATVDTERAALRADLAMVYAELEVARAALVDSVAAEEPMALQERYFGLLEAVRTELFEVLSRFESIRASLVFDGYSYHDPSASSVVAASQPVTAVSYVDNSQWEGLLNAERAERSRLETEIAALRANQANGPRMLEVPVTGLRQRRVSADPSGGRSGALGSLQIPTASARGIDNSSEPWTPVEGTFGRGISSAKLNAEVLTKIMHKLDKIPNRSSNSFNSLLFTLTALFLAYSAIHVHCASDSPTPFCTTIVPAYTSLTSGIHLMAESFVNDLVPHTHRTVKDVSKGVWERGVGLAKKIKAEREKTAAAREEMSRIVAAREEEERVKAAAAAAAAKEERERELAVAAKEKIERELAAAAEAERERQLAAAAEAERERERQLAAAAEAERERQLAAAAEAERERQLAAAVEAERERQLAAAAEAEKERELAAVAEAEKEKELAAAAESEKERELAAAAEAETERELAAVAEAEKERELAAAEAKRERERAAAVKEQMEREMAAAAEKEQLERDKASSDAAAAAEAERERERATAAEKEQIETEKTAYEAAVTEAERERETAAATKEQMEREKTAPEAAAAEAEMERVVAAKEQMERDLAAAAATQLGKDKAAASEAAVLAEDLQITSAVAIEARETSVKSVDEATTTPSSDKVTIESKVGESTEALSVAEEVVSSSTPIDPSSSSLNPPVPSPPPSMLHTSDSFEESLLIVNGTVLPVLDLMKDD
ncbi:hypothetical protein HDU67_009351 [Dinochytrium kinnereticum]|nr:hypothetical protein HDU67_009351 [Dinochytrium kinnereticum]